MIQWITDNWVAICATVTAAVLLAEKVVALTPSKSDDAILSRIEEVLTSFGIEKKPGA